MAINFNNPALANGYAAMLTDIRDMQAALATMDFSSATALPSGSISWNTTNNRFERWNGSAWAAAMPDATTSVRGLVILSNAVDSISPIIGANSYAVKTAYDAAVRAATTAVAGQVVLASNAETQAGTNATKAITPSNLEARTALTTRRGIVELATDAETQTGTDYERAVTPAGLRACTATDTRIGGVELATSAEAIAGTDTARAVTPAGLSAALRPTTVAYHVRAGAMQIYNGASGYPGGTLSITSGAAEDTWTTVGPTGSGATIIWDALDLLPSSARILIVTASVYFEGATANAYQRLRVYAAAGGVTPSASASAEVAMVTMDDQPSGAIAFKNGQAFIPLNSSRVFQCRWGRENAPSNPSAICYYKGFITD